MYVLIVMNTACMLFLMLIADPRCCAPYAGHGRKKTHKHAKRYVTAAYDYTAQEDDELTFSIGQVSVRFFFLSQTAVSVHAWRYIYIRIVKNKPHFKHD